MKQAGIVLVTASREAQIGSCLSVCMVEKVDPGVRIQDT